MSYKANFESIMAVNQRDSTRRSGYNNLCVAEAASHTTANLSRDRASRPGSATRLSNAAATAITGHFSITALLKGADAESGESLVLDWLWVWA